MVKGIYVLLTMFLLMGCATVMNPYKMDNRMHKIELGTVSYTHLDVYKRQIQSGIKRVVYSENYRIADGCELLKRAGIIVDYIDLNE